LALLERRHFVAAFFIERDFVVMIRVVFAIFIILVLLSALLPWLQKIGIGRLPGDLRFKVFGKIFTLPFSSTILLSLLVLVLARIL
jgi:hypothetical protein